MIEFTVGNIFESNADCLVNNVNCEGYMGKGIAYQFKMRFPENNSDYVKACKSGDLHIGTIHTFKENNVWIVNMPTKNKWREKSQIRYVEVGLDNLVDFIIKENPRKVAIPPLGCGNGGLDWSVVKNLIEQKLIKQNLKCDFVIYEPSVSYNAIPKQVPKLNVSALILLQIRMHLNKFNALRLQKAGYFTNYFLEEEYFKFDKWSYGPYAHSIDIIAKTISEYQKYYGLTNSENTYEQVYKVLCSKKTEEKLDKIVPAVEKAAGYINKIKTDKKLEGVATVLFIIIDSKGKFDKEAIVSQFKIWSEDKAKRFSQDYIESCIAYLEETNIIMKNICGYYELTNTVWK